ncbi:MAG TPA: carboxypeptidase-like regulatory domain-containing protein [Vicinamibacterales bacterium]|nr:carboxypeptidase-like regulatory domain-containing protein [Vicinamibacterales bacterium]
MAVRRLAAALAVALCAIAVGHAQSPPGRPVTGRVVADDTGAPIPDAAVGLIPRPHDGAVVLTDDDGRFTLARPSGPARVVAAKTGYGRLDVVVPADARPLEIRLVRGAVIAGRVTDETGEPVQGARVSAARAEPPVSGITLAVAAVTTDDRGEYRLPSLAPGRYVVSAMTQGAIRVFTIRPNEIAFGPSNLTTFYPDASSREGAQPIAVEAGSEHDGVDFAIAGARSIGARFTLVQTGPFAHAPAAQAGAQSRGTIRGHVVGTDGRSLAYADVRLVVELDLRQSLSARAGQDAVFEFHDLPAGVYRLFAVKTGYGPVADAGPEPRGVVRPGFPSMRVELGDGETKDRVDIRLARWGTISGRVSDEHGDPMQGARVEILQPRYERGRRRLRPAGALSVTDDLGRYRLFDVPPGQYIVSAAVGDVQSSDVPGYARAYFPNTTVPAEAQYVSSGLDQDLPGVDLAMSRTRTATISGTVVSSAGERAVVGRLVLTPSGSSSTATDVPVGARVGRDGAFDFANVPPGQYIITADRGRSGGSHEGEFGTLPVSVDGADVAGLTLQTSAGSAIHGRVTFEGADPSKQPRPGEIDISPVPVDFDLSPQAVANADVHDDWTFDMSGINGPRRLQVVRAPAGWALADVRVRGISVLDRPLAFGRADQSLQDVEIVLTDRVSEIAGTVVDSGGTPAPGTRLVVFAADRDRWYPGSRFMRLTVAGDEGRFAVTGLPFGAYYAAILPATPDDDEDGWQDPAALERLAASARSVTVREGEKSALELRVSGR